MSSNKNLDKRSNFMVFVMTFLLQACSSTPFYEYETKIPEREDKLTLIKNNDKVFDVEEKTINKQKKKPVNKEDTQNFLDEIIDDVLVLDKDDSIYIKIK